MILSIGGWSLSNSLAQELSLSNSGQFLLGHQGTALVTWNPVTSTQNLVLSNQEAIPY